MIPETNIPFALATVIDTIPFFRNQSRETETEHHCVGTRDLDGLVEVIDARGQDEVHAGT
jgi:hypothetical protein